MNEKSVATNIEKDLVELNNTMKTDSLIIVTGDGESAPVESDEVKNVILENAISETGANEDVREEERDEYSVASGDSLAQSSGELYKDDEITENGLRNKQMQGFSREAECVQLEIQHLKKLENLYIARKRVAELEAEVQLLEGGSKRASKSDDIDIKDVEALVNCFSGDDGYPIQQMIHINPMTWTALRRSC
ncbi:uncharacterized protein LOC122320279 [Drosophila ficusphila]|uniref:uncharacterized protein LOC122320279 n=1 Tax=Drosophila ficusphila TaxID=30025 RepID=UPI001C8AB1DB|nr:uncharacterized protein LOC122320279 [Drosophila ficusphila]